MRKRRPKESNKRRETLRKPKLRPGPEKLRFRRLKLQLNLSKRQRRMLVSNWPASKLTGRQEKKSRRVKQWQN